VTPNEIPPTDMTSKVLFLLIRSGMRKGMVLNYRMYDIFHVKKNPQIKKFLNQNPQMGIFLGN
jgi:hypothetical protein